MMGSTRSSRQRAKNVRRLFARSGVATLFALALAAPASSAGFVTAVTGVAEVKSGGTSSWTAATRDTQLSVGDALRTQKKASLQALLPDNTLLVLGSDTKVSLERAGRRKGLVLRQARGQLRAEVPKAPGKAGPLQVQTATAIVEGAGATLEVLVRSDSGGKPVTTAVCVAGACTVRNADAAIAGEVALSGGRASVIRVGQAPGAPAKPGRGYVALRVKPPTAAGADDATDQLLFGKKSAGDELAESSTTNELDREAKNVTNETGLSVGPQEAFETDGLKP